MKVGEALEYGIDFLKSAGVEEIHPDVELMLAFSLKTDRAGIYRRSDEEIDHSCIERFFGYLNRRASHEPPQYILGYSEFYGRKFMVTKDVMIPRPETELLVDEALQFCSGISNPRVLEICTGAGNIAVTLKKEIPSAIIFASDLSEKALMLARLNSEQNGVTDNIFFACVDLFAGFRLRNEYDVIIANPPYIPSERIGTLPLEVRLFEPHLALDGGVNGLDIVHKIINEATYYLKAGGMLLIEIDSEHSLEASEMAKRKQEYRCVSILKDIASRDRALRAFKV